MLYSEMLSLKLKQTRMKEKGRGEGGKGEIGREKTDRERGERKGRRREIQDERKKRTQGGKGGGEGVMLRLPFDVAVAGRFLGISRNKGLYIAISRDLMWKNKGTGVVPHACRLAPQRLRQEEYCDLKTILDYVVNSS